MKKMFFTLLFAAVLSSIDASAQTIDLGKFTIDKNTCTITRKSDGKTFPLHGKVEIVDHNPDVFVMPHHNPTDCGAYELVDHNPDVRVELVDHNPDLTVEVRDFHPHINR